MSCSFLCVGHESSMSFWRLYITCTQTSVQWGSTPKGPRRRIFSFDIPTTSNSSSSMPVQIRWCGLALMIRPNSKAIRIEIMSLLSPSPGIPVTVLISSIPFDDSPGMTCSVISWRLIHWARPYKCFWCFIRLDILRLMDFVDDALTTNYVEMLSLPTCTF